MRQQGCIPDEKWLLGSERVIDEIIDWLERLASYVEALVAVATARVLVADRHAVGKATSGKVILPPLAGLQTPIPFALQFPGQGGHLFEEGRHLLATGPVFLALVEVTFGHAAGTRRIIAHHFVLMRIKPGDDRRQAGTAQTRRHIAARKEQ